MYQGDVDFKKHDQKLNLIEYRTTIDGMKQTNLLKKETELIELRLWWFGEQ